MINCVVVDDELIARTAVEQCIKNTPYLNLLASYESATEFAKHVSDTPVDLVFLDIEMPGMSGVDFVKAYKNIPQVVFVTSNTSFAFEAYQYDVTDYIEKPIDMNRFRHAVEKVSQLQRSATEQAVVPKQLFFKSGSQLLKINLEELLYVEALGDYVRLITDNEKHTILATMKAVTDKLALFGFARVHKSYIVNLNRLTKVSATKVLVNEKEIPVGRVYKTSFKEHINKL